MFAKISTCISLFCCLLAAAASTGLAFTLDTPVVFDSSHSAMCSLYNLHPTKTCTVNSVSGLYSGALNSASFPPASSSGASFLNSTVAPGAYVITTPASSLPASGLMCHFDISGCPKAKVRAVLVFDGGATVPAN